MESLEVTWINEVAPKLTRNTLRSFLKGLFQQLTARIPASSVGYCGAINARNQIRRQSVCCMPVSEWTWPVFCTSWNFQVEINSAIIAQTISRLRKLVKLSTLTVERNCKASDELEVTTYYVDFKYFIENCKLLIKNLNWRWIYRSTILFSR